MGYFGGLSFRGFTAYAGFATLKRKNFHAGKLSCRNPAIVVRRVWKKTASFFPQVGALDKPPASSYSCVEGSGLTVSKAWTVLPSIFD